MKRMAFKVTTYSNGEKTFDSVSFGLNPGNLS